MNLKKLGLLEILNYKVLQEKVPIIGICLGMQLMTKKSEEGKLEGLGWINGETIKFVSDKYKVPHMGWNTLNIKKYSKLFEGMDGEIRFYFVHSYYVKCSDAEDTLTTTYYINEFVSSFERNNIVGVQFHPEKSHKFGMKVFRNFIERY